MLNRSFQSYVCVKTPNKLLVPMTLMAYKNKQLLTKKLYQHRKLERALGRAHTFTNATFVTISEDRELKSEHLTLASYESDEN